MLRYLAIIGTLCAAVSNGSICEMQPDKKDPTNCGEYYKCGSSTKEPQREQCPPGLGFSSTKGVCDWADLIEECDVEAYLDFECPPIIAGDLAGQSKAYPYPADCLKQLVCVTSEFQDTRRVPRLLSCNRPEVFDPETLKCRYYKEVKGCEDYFEKVRNPPKPVAASTEEEAGDIPEERIVPRNPTSRPVPEVRRTVTKKPEPEIKRPPVGPQRIRKGGRRRTTTTTTTTPAPSTEAEEYYDYYEDGEAPKESKNTTSSP